MTQEELDNMPLHWSHGDGYGNRLVKVSDDYYQASDSSGNVTIYSGQAICAITGGLPGALTGGTTVSITGNTIIGAPWPPMPSISTQEKQELDKLEEEHKTYIKQNRLNKFKALPKHLRQEIVDDAYIRDLTESLVSEDDKDFPDLARLQALRGKNTHSWNTGVISVGHHGLFGHIVQSNSKYEPILRHFKTEELAKAHAEVCIEEEIKD